MHFSGQEVLVVLTVGLMMLAPIAAAIWVYADATRCKNTYAPLWLIGTLFCFAPILIAYLIVRPTFNAKEQE